MSRSEGTGRGNGTAVHARPASTTASSANPFPGPRPFTEVEADLFFGRDREIEHLLALLTVERAVLVHAPSGAGKSSLINAGLIPRARARGFDAMPVARVRDPVGARRQDTENRYVGNVLENWRDDPVLAGAQGASTRAATLVDVVSALGPAAEPGRIIVLDQFEELFLYPESWRDRAELFRQVQAALDHDPRLKVLFVLRDDYLARLEPFTPLLRDRLRSRYPIVGLTYAQALAATVEPFNKAGLAFAPGAADLIVRGLLLQPAEDPTAPRYEGEHVEPVQLQIVCRTLFDRLAERVPPVDVITKADVDIYADVDQALAGFYDQAVTAATKASRHVDERQVRLWFEKRLITPSRARNRVLRETEKTGGLHNEVVDELEQRRVVRAEPRGPDRWYELTHDRFVDAVLTSNRAWFTSPEGRNRRPLLWTLMLGLLPGLVLGAALLSRGSGSEGSEEITKYDELVSASDTAVFEVDGRQGQLITALLRPSGDLQGHLELFGSAPTPLAASEDSFKRGALLTAELNETGVFRLVASARESTSGSFALTIRVETVGVRNRAIGAGTTQDGTISAPDEVDIYTFDGAKDTIVRVTMEAPQDLDSFLTLIAPGGGVFFDDDGVGSSGDAVLVLVLPETSTYSLRASSSGRSTGSYRLRLENLDAANLTDTAAGDVDAQNPVQVSVVRNPDGGLATFRLVPDPRMNADLRLLQPDGTLLYRADDQSAGMVETLRYPLVPEATYLLLIASHDSSTAGSYSISLEVRPPIDLTEQTHSGELRADDADVYRLDAEAGQVATVSVTADVALVAQVNVFGPDGTPLVDGQQAKDGETLLFATRLPARGPYIVVVAPASADQSTGTYSLSLTRTQGRTRGS